MFSRIIRGQRQRTIQQHLFVSFIIFCSVVGRLSAFVVFHPTQQGSPQYHHRAGLISQQRSPGPRLFSQIPAIILIIDDDGSQQGNGGGNEDEEEEDDEDDDTANERDPYLEVASSEFLDAELSNDTRSSSRSSIVPSVGGGLSSSSSPTTRIDWGGALGRLRERVEDVESGASQNPSKALFRLMSSEPPNQAIGSFISRANPQVIEAMSSAVGSLLGGLASPLSGVEIIVKASGDKMASLCFQLQMTGYMFRNAEYVMALKKLMDISGSATLEDYKEAFDKLDKDGSGYIEAREVRALLDDVYKGETPSFEIKAFLKFFDEDNDGRVSWEEFKLGLGTAMAQSARSNKKKSKVQKLLSPAQEDGKSKTAVENDEDDDDDEYPAMESTVVGTIEIELEDGQTVEVDAAEYLQSLKDEARLLKEELLRENLGKSGANGAGGQVTEFLNGGGRQEQQQQQQSFSDDDFGGIASYIASRQGDIKALTQGISPEIVETMKLLVDFVLEGGVGKNKTRKDSYQKSMVQQKKQSSKEQMSMEIPASALQQLALWQLILGYQLREAEAKGDYLKLLE